MFPRTSRLTRKRDLQKVYKSGLSSSGKWLFVRALASHRPASRFTVITSKKVAKKAVVRNRLKRLVREAVMEIQSTLPRRDYVVTIHRMPDESQTNLAATKMEIAQCFARLPSN